jgi:hypothetical protein
MGSFGVTFSRATSSALAPIRCPTPVSHTWKQGLSVREVTQSPGTLPGPGFEGFIKNKENVIQGTRVDLKAYYGSLMTDEQKLRTQAAQLGVPVQQKKRTRNVSNVAMGDNFYWAGRHMFQTTNQEAYPDIAKARKQALPITRVQYTAVEQDAAKELANMIQFKSDGQFADMQKAFLEYDKDRSGTLDRDELAQICRRFNLGNGDERVVQALIDLVDKDGSGIIDYEEFAHGLGSHIRSESQDPSHHERHQ